MAWRTRAQEGKGLQPGLPEEAGVADWQVLMNPEKLWVQVLWDKYVQERDFFQEYVHTQCIVGLAKHYERKGCVGNVCLLGTKVYYRF